MSPTSYTPEQLRACAHTRVAAVADLAQRICEVPAPTGSERERAELVASLWRERGYVPEIDALGNVYIRRGKQGKETRGPVLMLLAHTDTVFPPSIPITVERAGDILRGPGIGDNSASVAAMISAIEVLDVLDIETAVDLVAVADVGEEGLGNLGGARAAVERYRESLGAVLVLDGSLGQITHSAVGSQRWRLHVRGPGGHSFGAFGLPSAIHGLGRIIAAIAAIDVPLVPKTTFNVGVIEGGTSVNTIAAHASALLDMRSTDRGALNHLASQVRAIMETRAGEGLQTEIEILGDRPTGERSRSDPLVNLAAQTLSWLGIEPQYGASSTDANIPLSLNIPAVCVGLTRGGGVHTVEEYIHIPPIGDGLAQIIYLCLEACKLIAQQKL